MSERCLQCGAMLPRGYTCQTLHDELLNFESLNAIPHSIHFLHVTSFMIQHKRYSDEGLVWAQSMLQDNLTENLTEQQHLQLLRTGGKRSASRTRTWKFNRAADARPLPEIAWSLTIAEVAQHMHTVEEYGACVRQWASATLQQMTALL